MQKKKNLTQKIVSSLVILAVILTTFLNPLITQAQEANPIDLGISPPTTYLVVKPGEKQQHLVTVEQRGSIPLEITPSIVDFSTDGISGQPVLENGTTFRHITLDAGSIPDLNPQDDIPSFILQPGQKRNVALNIDIPQDATEREYHLSLLFRAKAADGLLIGSGQTEVSGVVASNLILMVSRSERDRGDLSISSITPPFLLDSLAGLNFTIQAKNSGLNATTASGSATVTDWRGKVVAELPIYPDMILAGSSRNLRTTSDGSNPLLDPLAESDQEEASLDPSLLTPIFSYDPFFLLGPYTITVELQKNGQLAEQGTSTLTITTTALPYSIFVIILVVLLGWLFSRGLFSAIITKPLHIGDQTEEEIIRDET